MGIHSFLKGLSSKVNVIVRLEFELDYYNVAVQYVSHYATVLSLLKLWLNNTCKL